MRLATSLSGRPAKWRRVSACRCGSGSGGSRGAGGRGRGPVGGGGLVGGVGAAARSVAGPAEGAGGAFAWGTGLSDQQFVESGEGAGQVGLQRAARDVVFLCPGLGTGVEEVVQQDLAQPGEQLGVALAGERRQVLVGLDERFLDE